jgi:hypothetical protein
MRPVTQNDDAEIASDQFVTIPTLEARCTVSADSNSSTAGGRQFDGL